MNLLKLFNVLGDRINVTLSKDLGPEERQVENEQTALIIGVAKQMINTGDLILRTEKLNAQCRNLHDSIAMKLVLGDNDESEKQNKME